MSTTIETLLERVATAAPVSIDKDLGRIRRVKVLGSRSANGRVYEESALRAAVPKYQGAKVFIDHPNRQSPTSDRSYRDQIGHLESVRFERGAIYADLAYNPKHPLAGMLEWDAENRPTAVGLSHNSEGRVAKRNGATVVEEITAVHSVDLVCNPATTSGLFESVWEFSQPIDAADFARMITSRALVESEAADIDPETAKIKTLRTLILGAFASDADLATIIGRIRRILDAKDSGGKSKPEGDEPAPTVESIGNFARALGVTPRAEDITEARRFAGAISSRVF